MNEDKKNEKEAKLATIATKGMGIILLLASVAFGLNKKRGKK